MNTGKSIEEIIREIEPVDGDWLEKARARTRSLVMPTRALGRLHEIAEQICAIQRTLTPAIGRKAILIMAGDHGVVAEGVSAYPQSVTVGDDPHLSQGRGRHQRSGKTGGRRCRRGGCRDYSGSGSGYVRRR